MKFNILIIILLAAFGLNGQTLIQKMYKQKRYSEIVEQAPKAKSLGGPDIFCIGQSFMKLEDDEQALEMFNQSINKGYKNGEIYYAKGIAETNLKQYTAAQMSFRQALYFLPNRKKILIEMAGCYYKANELDSALAVYQKIEENWGDFMPAVLMTCQIQHEQEKYAAALDCYYTKLPFLKRDDFYYRQALEAVMRIEWHHFENYYKAEVAIKNLLDAFPEDYQYNMLLMQLYNSTFRFGEASRQEKHIMKGYSDLNLDNSFYQKGVMVIDQFDTAQYHIEVFRNFQPEMDNHCVYKAFIFNYNGTRPLGKTKVEVSDSTSTVSGYLIDIPLQTDVPISYEAFKNTMLLGLFLPEIPDNDTIVEE